MRQFEQLLVFVDLLVVADLVDGVFHRRLRESGVATAKQKCLDATKQIQDSSARSTAEQACNGITTSNANVSAALSKAKQTCLTAAAKIPITSLKQAAEAQCNKIAAP